MTRDRRADQSSIARPLIGGLQGALGEHAGEMALIIRRWRGRCRQDRSSSARTRRRRGSASSVGDWPIRRRGRRAGIDRRFADAAKGEPSCRCMRRASSSVIMCGHADDGEIAAPARDLHEAGAGARRRAAAARSRPASRRARAPWSVRSTKKSARLDPALAASPIARASGRAAPARSPAVPTPDRHAQDCRRSCRGCGSADARCAAAPRAISGNMPRQRPRSRSSVR